MPRNSEPTLNNRVRELRLARDGMTQQALDIATKIYEVLFTPAGIFVSGCISGIIAGIIIALILAAILKKSPPIGA